MRLSCSPITFASELPNCSGRRTEGDRCQFANRVRHPLRPGVNYLRAQRCGTDWERTGWWSGGSLNSGRPGQTLIDAWLRRQETRPDEPDADHADREQAAFRQHFPREIVLIDLETCGLAGSMVFLTGLLHDGREGLTLTQLFARDYSEEPAALVTLWEILAGKRVLVTFNGKSFDWPMLRDRTTYHRLERELCDLAPVRDSIQAERAHFDLLHHARRRYAAELPDCRLATLEQHVCQRRRVGDIAGSDIPAAYHAFVRSGDATDMHSVLHHNALDLVTLLELALKITGPGDAG